MNASHRLRQLLLAAACPTLLVGCMDGKVLTFHKYDESSDSFAFMEVYANIAARGDRDVDHIAELWQRRNDLIVDVIPKIELFGSETILERRGKHGYVVTPLGQTPNQEPEVLTTAVDLDQIQVMPGAFFLNEHKSLCYYHQVVIPGSTFDAAMGEITPKIAEYFAEFAQDAQEKINRVRKDGSKPITWSDIRESIVASFDEPVEKPAKIETAQTKAGPLDAESLQLLIAAGADGSAKFTRDANTFTLVVPLSRRDCDEAIATIDLLRETVAERQKTGKKVDDGAWVALDAIAARHVEGSGLCVTVDLGEVWQIAARESQPMPAPNPVMAHAYQTTVASIQARGIEVNDKDLFPMILEQFNGTTKSQ